LETTNDLNKKCGGFFIISNRIVDTGLLAKMKGSTFKVLAVLSRYKNRNSLQCFPSLRRIQTDAGLSRGIVQSSIKDLESYGLISKHRYHSGRKFKCVYTLADPEKAHLTVPANKPKKSASWEDQKREKTGKFGIKPKKSTETNKPRKFTVANKPTFTAYNNLEQDLTNSDQSPPSAPQGGNGSFGLRTSEPIRSSFFISPETIMKFIDLKGEAWIRDYLRNKGYPIPDFLFKPSESNKSN
jgi:hypothetical protein